MPLTLSMPDRAPADARIEPRFLAQLRNAMAAQGLTEGGFALVGTPEAFANGNARPVGVALRFGPGMDGGLQIYRLLSRMIVDRVFPREVAALEGSLARAPGAQALLMADVELGPDGIGILLAGRDGRARGQSGFEAFALVGRDGLILRAEDPPELETREPIRFVSRRGGLTARDGATEPSDGPLR